MQPVVSEDPTNGDPLGLASWPDELNRDAVMPSFVAW
jgi:hypothetical protein